MYNDEVVTFLDFRNECKHYVTEHELIGLRQRLLAVAQRDRNAGDSGIYTIKSLYFDNCYDKALSEKNSGIDKREKFRIRYYNDDTSFIRLEKKSKIAGMCLKQSAKLTYDEVLSILRGDTRWMQFSSDELICELWAKMQYQLLRPKSVVVYDREAFIYPPGNVRVTIDSNIRGSEFISNFFNMNDVNLKLFTMKILEVKWDAFLPQVIRDIVQLNDVKTSSFSKYAATRFSAF